MSATLDTLSPTACTVSPITRDGGEFRWTVYTIEVDEDGPRIEMARYRTDSEGQGVWTWQATGGEWVDRAGDVVSREYEWKQVTGWAQFNLNCSPSTRRNRVLAWLDYGQDGQTAREDYARRDRIPAELLA